jgi:acetyltransferase-like isoleucine patch superfamily enzyme
MKKVLKYLSFIPFIKRFYYRKYYATGFGTYLVNSFFKRILRIDSKSDFLLHFTSRINNSKKLIIKNKVVAQSVYLSLATSGNCYYQAINGIEIGAGTIWANGCSFISANHSFLNLNKHIKSKGIIIGSNVWFGSNCVVLPEVEIGDNCIIGAGTIVTKSIPKNSVVVGNPGKIIAKRCENCLKKIALTEEKLCNSCRKL